MTKRDYQLIMRKAWDKRGRTGGITKAGYRILGSNGVRIYEHRQVMESYLGRKLKKGEHVHHLNGNKLDNRIENLELLPGRTHERLHAIKRGFGKNRVGIPPTNKTPIEIRRDIAALRWQGYFIREIASMVGVSYPTAWKYCKEMGARI